MRWITNTWQSKQDAEMAGERQGARGPTAQVGCVKKVARSER